MYRVQRQMLLRADGSPVTFVQTPHQGRPGSLRPILLVFHAIGGGSLNACLARLRERLARTSAHLVIGRAGASTCSELAVAALPSVLIPLKIAMDDHQTLNARALSEAGAAKVIAEDDLTVESLTAALTAILRSSVAT